MEQKSRQCSAPRLWNVLAGTVILRGGLLVGLLWPQDGRGGEAPSPLCLASSPLLLGRMDNTVLPSAQQKTMDQSEDKVVSQALVTLVRHALKADPSLLMQAYDHIIAHLPDASTEPYAQGIVNRLTQQPALWRQLAGSINGPCLVVFLDPTCPYSATLMQHLLHLSQTTLRGWHVRPFWWTLRKDGMQDRVRRALWMLSIHGHIAPFCQMLHQKGYGLNQLTESMVYAILESMGLNAQVFQRAMDHPSLSTLLHQVDTIVHQLNIQSFPMMIYKQRSPGDQQPTFRLLQGTPHHPDEVVRWIQEGGSTIG